MKYDSDFEVLANYNVAGFKQRLQTLPENEWVSDVSRQAAFPVHSKTQSLLFMWEKNDDVNNVQILKHFSVFQRELLPIFRLIKQAINKRDAVKLAKEKHGAGHFIKAMLVRLPAGMSVSKHNDVSRALVLSHRVHLPILTHPDVIFEIDDKPYSMPEGQLFELNNQKYHAVHNRSSVDRIHLIADFYQPGEEVLDVEGNPLPEWFTNG